MENTLNIQTDVFCPMDIDTNLLKINIDDLFIKAAKNSRIIRNLKRKYNFVNKAVYAKTKTVI